MKRQNAEHRKPLGAAHTRRHHIFIVGSIIKRRIPLFSSICLCQAFHSIKVQLFIFYVYTYAFQSLREVTVTQRTCYNNIVCKPNCVFNSIIGLGVCKTSREFCKQKQRNAGEHGHFATKI